MALQLYAGLSLTFVLAALLPILLFVLGPLIFGVAHIASEVRYLVVRGSTSLAAKATMILGSLTLLGLRAVELWRGDSVSSARAEFVLASLWIGVAAWLGAKRERRWQRAAALSVGSTLLAALAVMAPREARVVFAHGHNVVAIAIWATLYHRRGASLHGPFALLFSAVLVLLTGQTMQLAEAFGGLRLGSFHLFGALDALAPGLAFPFADGLLLTYVYLQSIHYAVWLQWIPQAVSGRETSSLRGSFRNLVRDLGKGGVTLVAASVLTLLVLGCSAPHHTRSVYLALANFHGYLELAALAFHVARGSALLAPGRPAPCT